MFNAWHMFPLFGRFHICFLSFRMFRTCFPWLRMLDFFPWNLRCAHFPRAYWWNDDPAITWIGHSVCHWFASLKIHMDSRWSHWILLALFDEPFSFVPSVRQIARGICVAKSTVCRRLVNSRHFTVRHQISSLGSSQALRQSEGKSSQVESSRVELSCGSDFATSCCPSGIKDKMGIHISPWRMSHGSTCRQIMRWDEMRWDDLTARWRWGPRSGEADDSEPEIDAKLHLDSRKGSAHYRNWTSCMDAEIHCCSMARLSCTRKHRGGMSKPHSSNCQTVQRYKSTKQTHIHFARFCQILPSKHRMTEMVFICSISHAFDSSHAWVRFDRLCFAYNALYFAIFRFVPICLVLFSFRQVSCCLYFATL
jgi:hypothetical protein